VIVEPVAANMGVVPPEPGFLEGLRALCTAHESLLVFDEVVTGSAWPIQGHRATSRSPPTSPSWARSWAGGSHVPGSAVAAT